MNLWKRLKTRKHRKFRSEQVDDPDPLVRAVIGNATTEARRKLASANHPRWDTSSSSSYDFGSSSGSGCDFSDSGGGSDGGGGGCD